MKLLFTLLFLTLLVNVDHIRWLGNYDKALQKAQKEQKPLCGNAIDANTIENILKEL
ncbi:MAG: hypothetical protein U9O24_00030 [Campylobacterota bacterium]|nr:hypothetical protein [Campylobacterota bacterium]